MVSNGFAGHICINQLDPRQELTHRSLAGIERETQGGHSMMRNVRMQEDGWTDGFQKGDADQLLQKTWTLEDIWEGPRSSMQCVDRTIRAGRLLVQLDRGLGHQAWLVDPPGDDGDMVAQMGGHRASKGDAVVKHHVRVVHDDVRC